MLPYLTKMGRRILHTGPLGSASVLKVVTNLFGNSQFGVMFEALATCQAAGMDLNTSFEAIKISSGNSFIMRQKASDLNGSRDINFTMDLVLKDIGLFDEVAKRAGLDLELSPLLISLFKKAIAKYGEREFSPRYIIKLIEEPAGLDITAQDFLQKFWMMNLKSLVMRWCLQGALKQRGVLAIR